MNTELVAVLLKFGGMMLIIMGFIMAVTLITPWLAKKVDKTLGKDEPEPERVDGEKIDGYEVKGPYDKDRLEGFDPNYKIYNTDIYSMGITERLSSKKKNKKD